MDPKYQSESKKMEKMILYYSKERKYNEVQQTHKYYNVNCEYQHFLRIKETYL